jgi:hypothetical protein
MNDKEIIIVNGIEYEFIEYYNRLERKDSKIAPVVLCSNCRNDSFRLSYGDYECIAHCKCGNTFTVYDG